MSWTGNIATVGCGVGSAVDGAFVGTGVEANIGTPVGAGVVGVRVIGADVIGAGVGIPVVGMGVGACVGIGVGRGVGACVGTGVASGVGFVLELVSALVSAAVSTR